MNDDISHTIVAKSDQLNACDLIAAPITVKVLGVSVSRGDQPVAIKIDGGHQPFKPCLTVRRILAKLWGPKSSDWIGRSMTLYCDEDVKWAGAEVGGIRVSHVTDIDKTQYVITRESRHSVVKAKIQPLVIAKEAYSDESIESNKQSWSEAFLSGKTSPEKLIAKIECGFTLSDEQKKVIRDLAHG